MKILMTGGSGFVGSSLTSRLVRDNHEVTVLTRTKKRAKSVTTGVFYLDGDPTCKGSWQERVRDHDILINLAGASIFSKWTDEYKRLLRDSRIQTTRNIVEALETSPQGQVTLFSTSGVGFYGFHGDEELTEESPPGKDFLAALSVDWEGEALKAKEKGARVVITRFGIVLGEKGGALGQMVSLFKKFIGGPLGSGQQWFSWVHIQDLAEAFVFLMNHPELSGPFNFCSPNPVRNKDLAKALGQALHRPSFMPAPGFMMKFVLGEFGSVLLQGQRVIPRRLRDNGFDFQYPEIEKALQSLVH